MSRFKDNDNNPLSDEWAQLEPKAKQRKVVVELPCYEPNSFRLEYSTEDLWTHLLLIGSSGAGKTTSLNHIIKDVILHEAENPEGKNAVLIFDFKEDDTVEKVRHWAKQCGREDDVRIVNGSGQFKLAVFPKATGSESIQHWVSLLIAALNFKDMGEHNAFFFETAKNVLREIAFFTNLNARSWLTPRIFLKKVAWWIKKRGLPEFTQTFDYIQANLNKRRDSLTPAEVLVIERLIDMGHCWNKMDFKSAGIFTSIISQFTNALSSCIETNYIWDGAEQSQIVDFSETLKEGHIVVVQVNQATRPEVAMMVGKLAKSAFYHAAQERKITFDDNSRSGMLIMDEYPLAVTAGDGRFSDIPQLQTLRSKKVSIIAATQGIYSLYRQIGYGETQSLLLNFNNILLFRSHEQEVEKWAQTVFGITKPESGYVEKTNQSEDGSIVTSEKSAWVKRPEPIIPTGALAKLETGQAYVKTYSQGPLTKPYWFEPLYFESDLEPEAKSPERDLRLAFLGLEEPENELDTE